MPEKSDYIEIQVEDDGVGADETTISKILDSSYPASSKTSFGLRGTSERLSIFYGIKNPLSIKSTYNVGTTVTIRIPVERKE